MARVPSSDATIADNSSADAPAGVARPPIGIWQPPPSATTRARSASRAAAVSASFTAATAAWVIALALTVAILATFVPAVRAARDAVIDTARPPASTAVQVAALFAPGYLIEAEAWALVDD